MNEYIKMNDKENIECMICFEKCNGENECFCNKCSNWKWYYRYHFAPLLKDLSIYLNTIDSFDIFIDQNEVPYTPEEQLKIVLPHQNNSYEYPNYTPLYSIMKRYYWECHPIMIH